MQDPFRSGRDPFKDGARGRERSRSRDRDRRRPAGDETMMKMAMGLSGGNPFKDATDKQAQEVLERRQKEAPKDPFADAEDEDPFTACLSAPGPTAAGAKDAWTQEREKLEGWERGGAAPAAKADARTQLSHLQGFLPDKAAASATGSAAAAAAAGSKREMQLTRGARYVVQNPMFDDADADQIVCDGCKKEKAREDYSDEALSLLGDCTERASENGPWRGMLVRIHDRGFGFIWSPPLSAKFGRDVFLHAGVVERVLGGRIQARQAIEEKLEQLSRDDCGSFGQTKRPYCRLQFNAQFMPNGEATIVAREPVQKLYVECRQCEQRRRMRALQKAESEKKAMAAIVAPTVNPASQKGFDPKQRLASVLGNLRGTLGLPQPGAANSMAAPRMFTK